MAQQTAVEWLHSELTKTWYDIKSSQKLLEQAKQMEKEQRIKDYNAGYTDAQCNHINDAENYINESDYINKTYNNGNSNTNI
jgi:hypothetical protein